MTYSKREKPVLKKCKICNKDFMVYAYIARKKPCKYCSMECALKARTKPKEIKICPICGKERIVSPWEIKRAKHGIFCSLKCYGKWKTKNLSGENSTAYIDGRSMTHGSKEWKQQRKLSLERDNYICQVCGTVKKGEKNLEVHHVIPVDQFMDMRKAHSLDNLITVCQKCHSKFHPLTKAQKLGLEFGRLGNNRKKK